MENDQNRTNFNLIIVLVAVILLIAIFVISNSFNKKEEKVVEEDSETIEKDTSVDQESNVYKSYEIGDEVVLLDSSKWHVIKKTTTKEDSVTLLKDEKLTTELKQDEAVSYLTTTYLKLLKDNLGALSTDINEVRLITLDDIKEITKMERVLKDTIIENDNNSWLTDENTLINEKSDDNYPLLICKNSENKGSICEGIGQELWSVRPVITISKDYIKE
jgi:hypothetical protein